MNTKANLGGGVIGLLLLVVGVFQFLSGDAWVVWIILGVLLGGVGAAGQLMNKKDS